jgi:hypothetical protein
MVMHTDAVHAGGSNYKREVQSLYAAIGALDDGIMSSQRKARVPKDVANGAARLHAALGFLNAADRDLASPSHDPSVERPRAGALAHTRDAIGAVKRLIVECRC